MPVPTASNVTQATARGMGYDGRLGDFYFRLAAAPDRPALVESADLEPERVNTSLNPEDFGSEYGARYSRNDFSGGEGLAFAHRRNSAEIDARRYYDSRNVDIDANGHLTMLESTENVEVSANTGLYADWDGTTLRWTDGTTLRTTTNPEAASPTIVAEDPHAAEGATTVTGIVTLGTDRYAGTGDGLHRYTALSGVWAHLHTEAGGVDRVWKAKGRVIFAAGSTLKELTDPVTPTVTTLVTLPTGAEWCDVADCGSHVLASASDGFVYAFTFDGAAFTLTGQTWLEGELPCGIGESFGVVFLGTATQVAGGKVGRLYRATLGDGGVLQGLTQIRKWGDEDTTFDHTPHWINSGRDSVFTAVREDANETHLWRYSLGSGGIYRSYILADGGLSRAFAIVDGVPWVWLDGYGPHRTTGLLSAEGYLISALADHFTSDEKSWAGITVNSTATTGAGDTVEVLYSPLRDDLDDAAAETWVSVATVSNSALDEELALTSVSTRYLAVQIKLTSDSDGANSATVESFSTRAGPGAGDTIVVLPVNVSDQITRPGRRRANIRGIGAELYTALQGIEGSATYLDLFSPLESLRGQVTKVSSPVLEMNRRGSATLVSRVTFRGRRLAGLSDDNEGPLGLNLLGLDLLG